MSGGIFLKRGDGMLEMREQPYDAESKLQSLLEDHPNLLAGDQVDPDVPRRWLMLSREAGLASEENGAGRWSIDHLLLDQDAIPTLVEVKRSSDSRIRREVVGQMLDYAANAVTYLNLDVLRARFEDRCTAAGHDAAGAVAELLDASDVAYEEFWERARTNLTAGRIRLVFVADIIPAELQRIVEFLNERMDPTQVLAVEIRQYIGGGEQMLIPRVIGQTARAKDKTSKTTRQWTEEEFFAALAERDPPAAEVARRIVHWARDRELRMAWGEGNQTGAWYPIIDHGTNWYAAIAIRTNGKLEFQFSRLKNKSPFSDGSVRREFADRLNAIAGIELPDDAIDRLPTVLLAQLQDEERLRELLQGLDWFYDRITQ